MKHQSDIVTGKGMFGGRLITFQSLPSSNQWAMENTIALVHGDVIWTIDQTAGKGRFYRQWVSPGSLCLTVSVILKPEQTGEALISKITQIAALAVAEALDHFAIPAKVKWPNDVMANDRKIAGILAEMDSATSIVALGIGLNVNMTKMDFKAIKLAQPATSMKIEGRCDYKVKDVLTYLLSKLERKILQFNHGTGLFPAEKWRNKDFLEDKTITVQSGDNSYTGRYLGVDETGRLKMTDEAGNEHSFWAGDVSVKAAD